MGFAAPEAQHMRSFSAPEACAFSTLERAQLQHWGDRKDAAAYARLQENGVEGGAGAASGGSARAATRSRNAAVPPAAASARRVSRGFNRGVQVRLWAAGFIRGHAQGWCNRGRECSSIDERGGMVAW